MLIGMQEPITDCLSIGSDKATGNWGSLWLVVMVWLVIYAWQIFYWLSWYHYNQINIGLLQLLFLGVLDWSFWLFATPLTLWVARHYPLVRPRYALFVHLPLSLVCCIGALALSSIVRIWIEPVEQRDFVGLVTSRLYVEGGWYFMFYWFVAGAYFAVDYHAAYRKKLTESLQLQLFSENLQRRLIEARLNTLKVQLRPHFLFNALHSVSSLMESSVPRAREMLIDLAELLRLALHISDRDTHPLSDEFDWLEKYLALEAIRFDGQLHWQLLLPKALESIAIPCLLLQPLVENALKHNNIQNDNQDDAVLALEIRAGMENKQAAITVSNNGSGLKPDWHEGYGLRFVRESLLTHCGDKASIELHNHADGGVIAKIIWPVLAGQPINPN